VNAPPEAIDDALVIGAGPGGLAAAIYLGRFRRRFRVVHDGESRAGWIPLSRNHPGFPDGVSGKDLLARMRAQAERYGAAVEEGRVERLERTGFGFTATVGGAPVHARAVILATGVVDKVPALPGVEAAIREGLVRICPICDGYEVQGQAVGVIGDDARGAREALFIASTFTPHVTLIHAGAPDALPAADRAALEAAGVELITAPVQAVQLDNRRIGALVFEGGEPRRFDALYSALGVAPRCELAVQAGAALADDGRLIVDEHQQTSVPGLYAAGDMVRGLNQISTAEGEAAIAATALHNRLREMAFTPVTLTTDTNERGRYR
jgi:thioredoxin reductase (NADPH)